MLADGWVDFLFALVPFEVVLQLRIHNKDGSHMVDVFTLLSVGKEILSTRTNISVGNLGQLCFDIEGEASKLLNVHRSSSPDILANILDQGLPNNNHLSLGLERFQVVCSSGGCMIVLSRVLVTMLEDPIDNLLYIDRKSVV